MASEQSVDLLRETTKYTSSVRLKRGEMMMVQAPQHFQCEGIVPTEPASPNSRTSLFHYCTRLSLFHPLLPFSHSPCLISSFFTLPIPPPPPPSLPEALSSELPRFFIKELSLKPSNYYGERENAERREGGHLRGKSVFHCFPCITLSFAPIPIHILHFSLSLHTLNVRRHRVSIAHPLAFLPLCLLSLSLVKC